MTFKLQKKQFSFQLKGGWLERSFCRFGVDGGSEAEADRFTWIVLFLST